MGNPLAKKLQNWKCNGYIFYVALSKEGIKEKNAPVGRNAANGDDVDYGYVYTNEDIFKNY